MNVQPLPFALSACFLALPASVRPADLPLPVAPRARMVAVEIDRDAARVLGSAVKDRPYLEAPLPPPRYRGEGGAVQVEVALLGPGGVRHVVRREVAGLCLAHDGDADPHIAGDTIQLHRESFIVELPALPGFDQVEIASYGGDEYQPLLEPIAVSPLAPDPQASGPRSDTSGAVTWPEDVGDPDRIRTYGNAAEVSKRINIVVIPDGYSYPDKAKMEADADALVAHFRGKTPYREHDPFLNYHLVYAYSVDGGTNATDQCDCSIVKDTAMNTRFPQRSSSYPCGDSRNRCLFYGTQNGGPDCDPNTSASNLTAAELRAPATDVAVVMVNTSRYGGCGGARAVYAASATNAADIAVHELGHSLAALADEYAGISSCGNGRGANISTNPTDGAWPEWVPIIGAPREGAFYYNQCVFRPENDCDMRTLNRPFCRVCNQQWALTFFGHARVSPTAPIEAQVPPSPVAAAVALPVDFAVQSRLATGAGVTNSYTWQVQGPGYPTPTTVGTAPVLNFAFTQAGTYDVTLDLVADTNFIQPARNGGNVDRARWVVNVSGSCDPLPVFAGATAAGDLDVCQATGVRVEWAPATFGPRGGTYEVWRDGLAVATGLAGSPYVDLPLDGAPHGYRVRAVSADCARSDGNSLDRIAADQFSSGPPPPMGNLLRAVKSGTGARASWTDLGPAQVYSLAASESRDFAAPGVLATPGSGSPGVDDPGPAPAGVRFYRVAWQVCGQLSSY